VRLRDEFEAHVRLFGAVWRFIGADWKAYEYHQVAADEHRLGARSLAHGKGARRVQPRPAEPTRRRAAQAPPAQKVIEEFSMDAQESTTEHLRAVRCVLAALDCREHDPLRPARSSAGARRQALLREAP